MPICTSCTHPTPYLYTIYQSAHNLRLEQCCRCHAFADPYVEHDTLTLLLDLILLKRDVYRHLLFNRAAGGRKAGESADSKDDDHMLSEWEMEKRRWLLIARLGAALIMVDAFIRWTHLSTGGSFDPAQMTLSDWNYSAIEGFLRILIGSLVETAAFHAGIMLGCFLVLKFMAYARASKLLSFRADPQMSGIRQEFRLSHVPLTLFYSSLTKLLLLFLLAVWLPQGHAPTAPTHAETLRANATTLTHPFAVRALEILDEDKLDREWVVRNVMGGMSAGFGLRVVLDCPPAFTTLVILGGWLVKTAVASFVSGWVGVGLGGNETAGEMWLAYSIP